MKKLAPYRKAAIAIVGAIGEAVSLGLLPAPFDKYAAVILAAAAAVGVYHAPNAAPAEA